MKQLKQSQFIKNGVEHENISSPETSTISTRVISISVDRYGKFQYTTDGVNYIELDPQTSEISSVDIIYQDESVLPENEPLGTILPAYTNSSLPVKLYEYTENDGWVEKALVNEYSIYYVTDKGTLYVFIGTSFVSTTPEQAIKIISPSSATLTDEEYNTLVANNCVLGTSISGLDWAQAGIILTKPFEYNGTLRGMYIRNSKIGTYLITMSTKTIGNGAQDIVLNQVAQFNGKGVPSYPSNTGTFNLQIVNGAITWSADNSGNFVTLATDQDITGKKTIVDTNISFKNSSASGNASWQAEEDVYGQLTLSRTYNNIKSKMVEFNGNSIKPVGANGNLGSSSQKWQDIYMGGILKDGNNSNYGLALPNTTSYTANETIATEKSVASGYVAKNTTSYSTKRVYGQGTQGDERMIQTSPNAYGQFLVERDANGMFYVNEPTQDTHPATKKYVDDGLATKQDTLTTAQQNAVDSGIDSTLVGQITTNANDITDINDKIPSEATSSNQLADKEFVNSSINNFASYYITKNALGEPFNTKAQLFSASTFYSGGSTRTPTINDYAIVTADETKGVVVSGYASFTTTADYIDYYVIYNNESVLVTDANKDDLGITAGTTIAYESLPTTRYSYQGGTYPNGQWEYLYSLNNTSFTQAQMNALNSGIDSTKVGQISTNASNITSLQSSKANDADVVHLAGAETITGVKTFKGVPVAKQITLVNNVDSPTGNSMYIINDNGYNGKIRFGNRGIMLTSGGQTISPDQNSGSDLGSSSYQWKDLYLSGKLSDGNNANYGVALPDTTSYTENKTIATTDQIPDVSTKMDKADPTGTGSFSLNRKENTTIGLRSVAVGYNTTASANNSFAQGNGTTASFANAHAEGQSSVASGSAAHAEGFSTDATGWFSHAEGNQSTASGGAAHAEGEYTTASGDDAHAEGVNTTASGSYSHAEGYYTTSQRKSQHVFGEYNVLDNGGSGEGTRGTYVEIVGNGTDLNTRSNARTLDWSGNEELTGNIIVKGGKIGDGKNANYKLAIPDTTSWTADKTIATTDQIPDASTMVTINTAQTISGEKTFTGNIKNTGIYYIGSSNAVLSSISGSALTIGDSGATLNFVGSGTLPTYNGSSLALDSGVVHTTGNETIGGTKTFSSDVNIFDTNVSSDDGIKIKNNGIIDAYYNGTLHRMISNVQNTTLSKVGIFVGNHTSGSNDAVVLQSYAQPRPYYRSSSNYGSTLKEIALLDDLYPVGAIYMSTNATSPASLFGGTWTQITDRFLIGAGQNYAVNATGGEATHTLTTDEMPSHRHNFSRPTAGNTWYSSGSKAWWASPLVTDYTGYSGGGQAHNNIPPYYAVYIWRRTA